MSSTAETEFQRLGLHPALGYKNSHDAERCFLRRTSWDTCGGPLSSCPRNIFDKLFLLPLPNRARTKEENLFVEENVPCGLVDEIRWYRGRIIFTIDADSRREFWEILLTIIITSKAMLQYYFWRLINCILFGWWEYFILNFDYYWRNSSMIDLVRILW